MKRENFDVILLAAGYSTRLYPLTKNFPKHLLEIGGKPVITSIVEKLEGLNGVNRTYIVTNNRYFPHFVEWKRNLNTTLEIEILNDGTMSEEHRLGAIGDTYFVIKEKEIANPLMVVCADNLFDFQLNELVSYFRKKERDVISVSVVTDKTMLRHLGVVSLDEDNKIVLFKEKPEEPFSNLATNGIHLYTRETVAMIKEYLMQGNNPDQPGRFLEWLYPRKDVYGFISKGRIIDIGTSESLEKARKEFTFSSYS
mgnify:CR=1 FL=1